MLDYEYRVEAIVWHMLAAQIQRALGNLSYCILSSKIIDSKNLHLHKMPRENTYFEPDLLEDFILHICGHCLSSPGRHQSPSVPYSSPPPCVSAWPSGLRYIQACPRTGGAGQAVSQSMVTIAQYQGGMASASSLRWAFDLRDLGGGREANSSHLE